MMGELNERSVARLVILMNRAEQQFLLVNTNELHNRARKFYELLVKLVSSMPQGCVCSPYSLYLLALALLQMITSWLAQLVSCVYVFLLANG